MIFLGVVVNESYFFLKIMHKVKTPNYKLQSLQRTGELLVKNILILCFLFGFN